jgi:hypothetical protein
MALSFGYGRMPRKKTYPFKRGEGGFKRRLDSLAHALELAQHFFVAEAYYPQPVAL